LSYPEDLRSLVDRHLESIHFAAAPGPDGARTEGLDEAMRYSLLAGGKRPDGLPQDGSFYLPTIIGGLRNDSALAQQEVFGPVLCVLPFDDEDDLIAQANDSVFGLAAGIWTRDYARAWRVARALQAGVVWINTYKQLSISVPFGGYKESGIGREKGISGMRLYQQSKALIWGLGQG